MNRYYINAGLEISKVEEISWEWEEDFPWLYARQDVATIQWRNDHLCAEFLNPDQNDKLQKELINLGATEIKVGIYR